MMPAISLNALPTLPPFQFLPEADLNFDAVLESVATPAPQTPATPEFSEPSETLLNFLGINPVKGQVSSSESPPVKEEIPDKAKDELTVPPPVANPLLTLSPISPQINEAIQIPPATGAPPLRLAIGGSQSKPSLSLTAREEGSTSVSSVRTELGGTVSPEYFKDTSSPIPLSTDGIGETPLSQAISSPQTGPAQPLASTSDPLRFVVDRQLDLARDSRWLDALARDIVAVADAPDRLSFRLSPPQLGQLDVDLSSSDSGLSVRMNASTEAAAQIVAAAQPRLIDELKSQGVRVAEAQVSTRSGGQSQGQGQQQQRAADQIIEFARARFERANETNLTRPTGRFA